MVKYNFFELNVHLYLLGLGRSLVIERAVELSNKCLMFINHSCEGLVEHDFSELNVNFYLLGLGRSLVIETALESRKKCL